MLNCDLCDYYCKAEGKSRAACVCELTGFEFLKEPQDYDMDNYPCFYFEFERKSNKNNLNEPPFTAGIKEKITA